MTDKNYCTYCDKELSEEKGELTHGCLDCCDSPATDKIDTLRQESLKLRSLFKEAHNLLIIATHDEGFDPSDAFCFIDRKDVDEIINSINNPLGRK